MAIIADTIMGSGHGGGSFALILEWDDTTADIVFDPDDETVADAEISRATADIIQFRLVNDSDQDAFVQLFRNGPNAWREGTILAGTEQTFPASGPVSKLEHLSRLSVKLGGL